MPDQLALSKTKQLIYCIGMPSAYRLVWIILKYSQHTSHDNFRKVMTPVCFIIVYPQNKKTCVLSSCTSLYFIHFMLYYLKLPFITSLSQFCIYIVSFTSQNISLDPPLHQILFKSLFPHSCNITLCYIQNFLLSIMNILLIT